MNTASTSQFSNLAKSPQRGLTLTPGVASGTCSRDSKRGGRSSYRPTTWTRRTCWATASLSSQRVCILRFFCISLVIDRIMTQSFRTTEMCWKFSLAEKQLRRGLLSDSKYNASRSNARCYRFQRKRTLRCGRDKAQQYLFPDTLSFRRAGNGQIKFKAFRNIFSKLNSEPNKDIISEVLDLLETNKTKLEIDSYGIRDSSLEEIFIKIASQEKAI